MAKAKTVFLNQQEMDLIHAQSIKSLQEIGIKVHSKPVLEILEKNGALTRLWKAFKRNLHYAPAIQSMI